MTIFKGFVKPSSSSKNSRYEKFAQKEHKSEHATEDMSNCHTNKCKPSETRRHALFEGSRQRHAGIMCCVALSSQWIHPHGAPVLPRFTGQDPTPPLTSLTFWAGTEWGGTNKTWRGPTHPPLEQNTNIEHVQVTRHARTTACDMDSMTSSDMRREK